MAEALAEFGAGFRRVVDKPGRLLDRLNLVHGSDGLQVRGGEGDFLSVLECGYFRARAPFSSSVCVRPKTVAAVSASTASAALVAVGIHVGVVVWWCLRLYPSYGVDDDMRLGQDDSGRLNRYPPGRIADKSYTKPFQIPPARGGHIRHQPAGPAFPPKYHSQQLNSRPSHRHLMRPDTDASSGSSTAALA